MKQLIHRLLDRVFPWRVREIRELHRTIGELRRHLEIALTRYEMTVAVGNVTLTLSEARKIRAAEVALLLSGAPHPDAYSAIRNREQNPK